MRYLHTMVRVTDIDRALDFYCAKLGLEEVTRVDNPAGRFTLVFLAAPEDAEAAKAKRAPMVELTHNWDPAAYDGGPHFGDPAYQGYEIHPNCRLSVAGALTVNRPP